MAGSATQAVMPTASLPVASNSLATPSAAPPVFERKAPTYSSQTVSSDPWEQVRMKLHSTAMSHAKEELRKRWEELEWEYKSMDPAARLKHCVMPSLSGSAQGTSFAVLQEQYAVWNKLSSAISRESLSDLKEALEHAAKIDFTSTSRAIIMTYCDALTRRQHAMEFSADEVVEALEQNLFQRSVDIVVEIAIVQGADVGLLLTWLTRLCADWSARASAASPPGGGTLESQRGDGSKQQASETDMGSLLSALFAKAVKHARLELNKAWDELDRIYSPEAAGDSSKGLGPQYTPFSREEELFYIRNKILCAINEQSLVELRRALAYALANGLDPESIEIECAYRDTLQRYQRDEGFLSAHVKNSLDGGDWWTALDLIIGVALARGVDVSLMQRTIGTFQQRQQPYQDAQTREVQQAEV